MKISYKKLWLMLVENELSKQEFRERCNFSTGTVTKLNKARCVSLETLLKICEVFDCNIGDVCDAVHDGELSKKP